jgi:hypothetical protein
MTLRQPSNIAEEEFEDLTVRHTSLWTVDDGERRWKIAFPMQMPRLIRAAAVKLIMISDAQYL